MYSGPLPHPDMLAKYEEIEKGTASRIIKMAENQSEHRQTIEKRVIQANIQNENTGMFLAFFMTITIILASAFLVFSGKDVSGLVMLFSGLGIQFINYFKQKKKESKSEFGKRLSEWYEQYDGQQKFHQETIHQPLISKEDLLNTYRRASDEIRKKTKKEEFYQNFQSCVRDWGFCEHYRLCHKGGETKENLVAFKIRERYKAQEPEKKGRK